MERRNTFFTSDWHIGHTNVIAYDSRPFRDTSHMAEVLISNFNASVGTNDLTYFLGDMGLCKGSELSEVVGRLNGTKVLVLGNHDKGAEAMHKIGFDVVVNGATLWIANQCVTLSHCPLKGVWREHGFGENWHGESRQHRFTTPNFGQFHLHGHIHSPNGGKSARVLAWRPIPTVR